MATTSPVTVPARTARVPLEHAIHAIRNPEKLTAV